MTICSPGLRVALLSCLIFFRLAYLVLRLRCDGLVGLGWGAVSLLLPGGGPSIHLRACVVGLIVHVVDVGR